MDDAELEETELLADVTGLDAADVLDEVKELSKDDNEELAVAEAPQSSSESDWASIEL